MLTESLLAYCHLAALLAMVVFATSQAALLRSEWLNAAVLARLLRVQRIYLVCLLALLITGLLRMTLGVKGLGWYHLQPLLWAKLLGLALLGWAAVAPGRAYRSWWQTWQAQGTLPAAETVAATRRQVMRAAHGMLLLPALAVLLARGVWTP